MLASQATHLRSCIISQVTGALAPDYHFVSDRSVDSPSG